MFKTDFICILTAGHTVDGREIPQQILNDVAQTYDVNTYNARINLEHEKGGWKAGNVLALKVEGNQLFAQLKPNELLLNLISQGQLLHTSCELTADFAKTGKWYLTGLALTDEPASLGTSELHLSTKNDATLFSTREAITPVKPSFLTKLFTKKDEDMNDEALLEMLSQMQETNAKQTDALTALASGMTDLTTKLTAKPKPAEEKLKEEAGTEGEKGADTTLTEKLTALTGVVEKQAESITGLTEQLSKITDEPDRDEANGGNKYDEEEIL